MTRTQPVFSIRNLTYKVPERLLLDDVSLDFRSGCVSALIGHNGSGKSTLLKLLARQMAPSAGQILFSGEAAAGFGSRRFAREVAYLPQDLAAAAGMTVGELAAAGRYPWHGALGRFTSADRAKVEEALEITHTASMRDRLVETLSGGERQRAWIAMLMAQDSRCLLLDEPTSALDIAHQLELLTLIRRLSREKSLSVIIVLHDVNMAARFADDIHALKSGRLVASGPAAAIMTDDTLRMIYGVDMTVMPHPALDIPLAYVS